MNIILTVQRTNCSWRLGLNKNDSTNYFNHREIVNFILPNTAEFSLKTACGTSSKKAFDFNSKELISNWITINEFDNFDRWEPTKLIFELKIKNNKKTLIFIRKRVLNENYE
jgi:hypothetical protein